MIKLKVNGSDKEFNGDEEMPLLWYLREELKYQGTKFGCGIGECGACTVHLDGSAVRSCSVPMSLVEGREIITIEGLARDEKLSPVQKAWVELDVPQCGYCQAGQIMAVTDFLRENPDPTDQDIDDNITNLCRCGTYTRIRKAIHHAAQLMKEEG